MDNIILSPKQADFITNSNHSFNISSGVTRSGKTFAQILRWYKHIYDSPEGSLLLMSGRTGESLYDNVIRDLLKLDTIGDFVWTSQPQKIYVKSKKIEIRCVGADNELANNRIQGKTIFGWLADEIVAHPRSFVDMAISRCSGDGKQAKKFWTCNPSFPSAYVKTQYIDNEELDVKNWYFGFPDNPILSQELITELKQSFTGAFYDRMILGKWSVAEGAVFENYSRETHYILERDYPAKSIISYIIGMDFGYAEGHETALILIAKSSEGIYYVIDEIVASKQLIDASMISKMRNKGWFNLPLWFHNGLDYALYEIKPETIFADSARPEYIYLMGQLTGIPVIPAVKNSNLEMLGAIQRLLDVDLNGKARLYFVNNGRLRVVLKEMDSYRWKGGIKGDEVVKEDDNTIDALKYAIHMSTRKKCVRIKDFRMG